MKGRLNQVTIEKAWQACLAKALRPVEGVLLDRTIAADLAERLINQELDSSSPLESEPSLVAHLIKCVTQSSKETVAHERLEFQDDNKHHDLNDQRYERNLSLPQLQKRNQDGEFNDPEWNKLLGFLKPFGHNELHKKGVQHQDAEDVYSETFAELIREKTDKAAPISRLTVFEEIIPLFVRMIQFRGLDWIRSRHAKKNQPNTQESIEDLASEERGNRQFEDTRETALGGDHPLSFEAIYYQCQEVLTPFEWQLIFSLYVSENATMGELLEDEKILQRLNLNKDDSSSTKRRRLNEQLDTTLTKLRSNLEF